MDGSTPGLPVHHQLSEFSQTHIHWISDAIQPSHPLLSPSPPAFNLSQHQGLFQWVSSSHQVKIMASGPITLWQIDGETMEAVRDYIFLGSKITADGDCSQIIGVSASASLLPMNIQDWFPLGLTVWISLQSKGLSRVFSNTTVQKHEFFGTQLSL